MSHSQQPRGSRVLSQKRKWWIGLSQRRSSPLLYKVASSLTPHLNSLSHLYSSPLPSGNLHHSQYCDKLRSIVEFLGVRLSLDELSSIWETQVNENPVQVENVHSILAAAASRFTPQHLDHLFTLVSQVRTHQHSL